MDEHQRQFTNHWIHFHCMESQAIALVFAMFAELVEAGVGVTQEGLRFNDPVTAVNGCTDIEHACPGIVAAVRVGQRIFNNRKGGWTYEILNSFGLLDFMG